MSGMADPQSGGPLPQKQLLRSTWTHLGAQLSLLTPKLDLWEGPLDRKAHREGKDKMGTEGRERKKRKCKAQGTISTRLFPTSSDVPG